MGSNFLWGGPIGKVFVVRPNNYRQDHHTKEVQPVAEGPDYGKEFSIMNFVIHLGGIELA